MKKQAAPPPVDRTTTATDLTALTPDPRNANTGTEYGQHLLRKSIQELGVGRGILAANDGTIIAGNQTLNMLAELGIDNVIMVPTDGRTIVVTQRMDIEPNSKAFHELALADNKVGQVNLHFDVEKVEQLSVDFDIHIDDWGFGEATESGDGGGGENNYSRKIEPPIYEPSDKAPLLKDLTDETKTQDLIAEITTADLPADVKDFLISAAHRHRVFNYQRIADYYAHAPAPVQRLMEKSALVVIDLEQAIANGFVKMSKTLSEQFTTDHESDDDTDTAQ